MFSSASLLDSLVIFLDKCDRVSDPALLFQSHMLDSPHTYLIMSSKPCAG